MGEQRAPFVPESLYRLGFVGRVINEQEVIIPPLVEVPAGPFLMGSDRRHDPQAYDPELPQHRVTLPTYRIGKYPLTAAEFACAVRAKAVDEPWVVDELGFFVGRTPVDWQMQLRRLDHPIVGVRLSQFVVYAKWLTKLTGVAWRLPSEAEWEKAARGSDGRIYPWGNRWDQSRANTSQVAHEIAKGSTTPVGMYPGGASPYGAIDMAGNVWEITTTTESSYPYNPHDGREDIDAKVQKPHILRGGSWYLVPRLARTACRYIISLPQDQFATRLVRV